MPHSLDVDAIYVLNESVALTSVAVGDYLTVNPAHGHDHAVYLLCRSLTRQEAERILATVDRPTANNERPHLGRPHLELVR